MAAHPVESAPVIVGEQSLQLADQLRQSPIRDRPSQSLHQSQVKVQVVTKFKRRGPVASPALNRWRK